MKQTTDNLHLIERSPMRRPPNRRRLLLSVASLLVAAAVSAPAAAQDMDPKGAMEATAPVPLDKYAYLKRLSLDLRAAPPTWEEVEALDGASEVPEATIDAWLDSDGFLEVMADYHRDLLWMNISNFSYVQFPWDLSRSTVGPSGDQHLVYYLRWRSPYHRGAPGTADNASIPCSHEPATFDAMGNPERVCEADGTCREGWVWVNPYWAPETPIKVCALDAQTAAVGNGGIACNTTSSRRETSCGCGPGLAFCDFGTVEREIGAELSEQPLQIVRWVIAEDRPYHEILTTRMSFVNGPIVHYYKHQMGLTSLLDLQPKPVDNVFLPEMPFTDKTWQPILQGEEHAGVLTSYGFLLRFQTNRSRVNRFYNAFLDSAFDATKGTGTSDCTDQGADLTKRCYCQNCHVAVEPWAAYWARWKQQGGGYLSQEGFPIYDDVCSSCAQTGVSSCPSRCRNEYVVETVPEDRRPYLGYLRGYEFLKPEHQLHTEVGPRLWVDRTLQDGSLGRGIVSKMWKHFMQRPFNDTQADKVLQEQLFATFVSSNYNIKALVKAIVTHPTYRRLR